MWGTALGLQGDIEQVLERSAEDASAGVTTYNPWLPAWYGSGSLVERRRRVPGRGAGPVLELGSDPRLRRHDVRPGLDRQLAQLERLGSASGGFSGGGSGGGGGGAGGGY